MRAVATTVLVAVAATAQPQDRFPGATWERMAPAEVGMSEALLGEALDYAGGLLGGGSRCVSVETRIRPRTATWFFGRRYSFALGCNGRRSQLENISGLDGWRGSFTRVSESYRWCVAPPKNGV